MMTVRCCHPVVISSASRSGVCLMVMLPLAVRNLIATSTPMRWSSWSQCGDSASTLASSGLSLRRNSTLPLYRFTSFSSASNCNCAQSGSLRRRSRSFSGIVTITVRTSWSGNRLPALLACPGNFPDCLDGFPGWSSDTFLPVLGRLGAAGEQGHAGLVLTNGLHIHLRVNKRGHPQCEAAIVLAVHASPPCADLILTLILTLMAQENACGPCHCLLASLPVIPG